MAYYKKWSRRKWYWYWRRKRRYKSRTLNTWFKKHPKSKITYIDYTNYKPTNTKTNLDWYYNTYNK